jgi:predicted site-specific integrase-resolvase
MELYTLASAAEKIGCTPNRLKVWIDKGYVPEMRIQMGKVRARVVDEASIEKIRRVLTAVDQEGLTIQGAFARYFDEQEVIET